MPNILKLLRSITPGVRPTGRTYGEMYVNFGDNQIGVFDSSNVARDLIGVPFFSSARSYPAGFTVVYQGTIYIALVAVSAGTWNPAQWGPAGQSKSLSVNFKIITASGTYTPTTGLAVAILEAIAGGGGGGLAAASPGYFWNGPGGGSGSYSRRVASAALIGASQVVTIGPGGAGGTYTGGSANYAGKDGGDTSIGSLCVAHGGKGAHWVDTTPNIYPGGAGGLPGTGDITGAGNAGEGSFYNQGAALGHMFGRGGPSAYGGGPAAAGPWPASGGIIVGPPGGNYGAGGSGGFAGNASSGNPAGGAGAPGVAFITEYIFA